jgi:hypothetical protein
VNAARALQLVNEELAKYGQPPISLNEDQTQKAYQSLCAYASRSGRPIEVAVADTVRFQMQQRALTDHDPMELERVVARMRVRMN